MSKKTDKYAAKQELTAIKRLIITMSSSMRIKSIATTETEYLLEQIQDHLKTVIESLVEEEKEGK